MNEFEKLKKSVFEITAKLYAENTEPDYDPIPTAIVVTEDGKHTVCALAGGPPGVLIPQLVRAMKPVMLATACPSFITKISADTQASERSEGVMFSFETPTFSEYWFADVVRDPLPVMGEPQQMPTGGPGESIGGRMTNLVHQHTRNS